MRIASDAHGFRAHRRKQPQEFGLPAVCDLLGCPQLPEYRRKQSQETKLLRFGGAEICLVVYCHGPNLQAERATYEAAIPLT